MLIFLVSTTEFGQLLKVPLLIEHYVEHKTNNPNLTMWGFLQIHYSESHKEEGDPVDEKLPFVTHHFVSIIGIVTPTPVLKIERIRFNTIHDKIHAFDEDEVESSYLSSIWQPPKYC
ncbi:hypothetical protein [Myroides albus]|uniref:Uncharacterized protein n=1 Tax=Myroides albus TaxID=2562892 RepID=A0A6I3LI47_9FLAO|nr:hypothetical protein [Myroides albus]MVX35471.1 hypothetical protein [Myroides sp. LoEW2-1]